MKIESYKYPKSSFLAMDKDMSIIIDYFLKNERLKKLLFYTTRDCLNKPNLNEDQSLELFGKNIKIVPKLYVDNSVLTYVIISFDNFVPSGNPEFRDSIVEFDIICHFDQWQLNDTQLRPYKIAAEIDTMFDGKSLTGIGELEFMGANQMVLTDEFAGLCLIYRAVHGGEDKKNADNPKEQDSLVTNFNQMYNE